MPRSSAPSQRQLRVGELVRHELAAALTRDGTGDAAADRGGVTVLEVSMSPDLKLATAYVRPLIGDDGEALIAALERNSRHLRGVLAPRLDLRFMPELRFRIDTRLDHAQRIESLLRSPEVQRDLAERPDDETS